MGSCPQRYMVARIGLAGAFAFGLGVTVGMQSGEEREDPRVHPSVARLRDLEYFGVTEPIGWPSRRVRVVESTPIPDVATLDYPDCLSVARVEALDGEKPTEFLIATVGVRNRVRNIALEAEGFYQLCVQPWSAMGDMSHSAQRVDAVERFDLDLYAACGAEFFDPASSLDLSSALVPFVHEWSSPLRTRVESLQEARDVLLARFSALSLPERFQRNERSLAELVRLRDSSLPVTRLHGGRFTLSGLSRLSPLRFRETGPGWPEPQMEVVRSLQEQLAERGVDLIVVPFPSREHVHAPFLISEPPEDGCVAVLREELLRELAMEGVEAIDLLPDFIEAKRGGGLLFHDARDCHAARDGLDLAARAIADRLRRYELPRSIDSIYTRAVSYKLRPENTDMPDKQYPAVQVVGSKGEVVPHEDLSSPIALVGDSFCYFPSHLGPKGTDLASQVAKYTGIVPRRVAIGAGGPRILQHIAERGPEFLDGVRVCVFVCFTDFWYGQAEKGSRRWCPAKLPL